VLCPVDADDGDALEHGLEEAVVALDVDFDQLQRHPLGDPLDDRPGVVAQVAARAPVERDDGNGQSARSPLA
jgi:hypothetical protein